MSLRTRISQPPGSVGVVTTGDWPVVYRDGVPFHRDTGERLVEVSWEEFMSETKLFRAEDFFIRYAVSRERGEALAKLANARIAPLVEALDALEYVASQCRNQGDALSVAQQCVPLLAAYRTLKGEG